MALLFTEPSLKEEPFKVPHVTDEDLFKTPFSVTKLRHSLSEGGGKPPLKPANGYHRMHSFHSTLSDNHWNENDRPILQNTASNASLLSSELRETIFKDFPDISKNGFHSHSFDGDIFEESTDNFSSGFFSESEIDVIPRSSLFHRTGLRRSTSQVESPKSHYVWRSRQDPDRETAESRENGARDAKIEELMRLKKELEELKANWQTNNDNLLVDDPPPKTKPRSACQNKSKEDMDEDVLESHSRVLKDKGKMKRRRLSSSQRSHSLSSKFMEEVLEEDEGSAEVETFDSEEQEKRMGPGSSSLKEDGKTSQSGRRISKDHSDDSPADFENEDGQATSVSGRQRMQRKYIPWDERRSTSVLEQDSHLSPQSDELNDTGDAFKTGWRHADQDEDDLSPGTRRGNMLDGFQKKSEEDENFAQVVNDLPSSYTGSKFGNPLRWGSWQLSSDAEDSSPSVRPKSKIENLSDGCRRQMGSDQECEVASKTTDRYMSRYDGVSSQSNRIRKDYDGNDNTYASSLNLEKSKSNNSSSERRGKTAKQKERVDSLSSPNLMKNAYDDVWQSETSNHHQENACVNMTSKELRQNSIDDVKKWSSTESDPEREESCLSSSGRRRCKDGGICKQEWDEHDSGVSARGFSDMVDGHVMPSLDAKENERSRRNVTKIDCGCHSEKHSKESERLSNGEDGHESPSYSNTGRENTLNSVQWKKKQRDSDSHSWSDICKEPLLRHRENTAVRTKPFLSRRTSLEPSDGFMESTSGQNFRRFSTSFDKNGLGEKRNSCRQGYMWPHPNSDKEKEPAGISSNLRRKSREDKLHGEKQLDNQKDSFSSIRYPKDSALYKRANSISSSKSPEGIGMQLMGSPHERKSKQSLRHGNFGMDDIFEKLSIPRREFFEDEFFARDRKRHLLMEEIRGIQRNLADITKRELKKKQNREKDEQEGDADKELRWNPAKFRIRRSPSEIDLQTERSNLIGLLKQLLNEKQEREQQIRQQLDQLKSKQQAQVDENRDHPCKADEDGVEKQETCSKMKTVTTDVPIIQRDDEDEVSFVMRRAGADDFIPVVKKNGITIDLLYQLVPSNFSDLGITDPNLQKKLQEEIDRHFVEQKNAQLKAAELEKPVKKSDEDSDKEESREALCSEISSAPEGYEPDVPVHVSAECVVCLDNQSNLLFLNCGHVCCCYDCAVNLKLCPLCRADIVSKLIMNDSLPGVLADS